VGRARLRESSVDRAPGRLLADALIGGELWSFKLRRGRCPCFSGTNVVAENVAVASGSAVEKVTLQWAGVSASSSTTGVIAATTFSNPAALSSRFLRDSQV